MVDRKESVSAADMSIKQISNNLESSIFREPRTRTSPGQSQVEWLAKLEVDGEVYGVTELLGRIYVICYESNKIWVFRSAGSFEHLNDIVIKSKENKTKPWDITSCTSHRCLYVNDTGNYVIWKVLVDAQPPVVTKWSSTDKKSLSGTISVTSDGRILLGAYEPPRLEIYSPEAELIETIPLPGEIDQIFHAMETTSRDFLVCHERCDGTVVRVSLINNEGQMLRSYGGKRGRGKGQLDRPAHLALDGEGNICVVDFGNSLVLVLDSAIKDCRVLLSEQENRVKSPYRIYYSIETGRLIVGQYNRQVDVYNASALIVRDRHVLDLFL